MLVVSDAIRIPLFEFSFTFSRSSGPGGQNVNKVNTRATLRWPISGSRSLPDAVKARFFARYGSQISGPGEIVITSDRFRSQGRNIADCLEKLRAMLAAVATAPKKRRPTKPTRSSRLARHEGKRLHARKKKLRGRPRGDEG